MKKWMIACLTLVLFISCLSAAIAKTHKTGWEKQKKNSFEAGEEVLLNDRIDLLKGKRVGGLVVPRPSDTFVPSSSAAPG